MGYWDCVFAGYKAGHSQKNRRPQGTLLGARGGGACTGRDTFLGGSEGRKVSSRAQGNAIWKVSTKKTKKVNRGGIQQGEAPGIVRRRKINTACIRGASNLIRGERSGAKGDLSQEGGNIRVAFRKSLMTEEIYFSKICQEKLLKGERGQKRGSQGNLSPFFTEGEEGGQSCLLGREKTSIPGGRSAPGGNGGEKKSPGGIGFGVWLGKCERSVAE